MPEIDLSNAPDQPGSGRGASVNLSGAPDQPRADAGPVDLSGAPDRLPVRDEKQLNELVQALADAEAFGIPPATAYRTREALSAAAAGKPKMRAARESARETVKRRWGVGVTGTWAETGWAQGFYETLKGFPRRVQRAAGRLMQMWDESEFSNGLSKAQKLGFAGLRGIGMTPVLESKFKVGEAIAKNAEEHLAELAPDVDPHGVKAYVFGATASVMDNLAWLVPSLLTGQPELALVGMGAMATGQAYGEQREGGSDPRTATLAALGYGASEILTEFIPLGQYLKPSVPFVKRLIYATVAEVPTEVANEWAQIAIDKVTLAPDMTLAEATQRVTDTVIQTALATPFITGGVQVAHRTFRPKLDIDGGQRKEAQERAKAAEEGGEDAATVVQPERRGTPLPAVTDETEAPLELRPGEAVEPTEEQIADIVEEKPPETPLQPVEGEISDVEADQLIQGEQEFDGEERILSDEEIDTFWDDVGDAEIPVAEDRTATVGFTLAFDDIVASLESMVEHGEAGTRLQDQVTGEFFGVPSTFPEFMKNKGWRKAEVLTAIRKGNEGKKLTDRQQGIYEATLEAAESAFVRQVRRTNPDAAASARNFAAQTVTFRLDRERQAELARLVKAVEKAQGKRRGNVKQRIRQATGQVKTGIKQVPEDVALRETFRQSVKAARQAFKAGKDVGAEREKIKQINREILTRRKQREREERQKAIGVIKKAKKGYPRNIAVDYKKRIDAIVSGIDLKKPSQKTIRDLESLKEYIEREGDLGIPRERIAALDRLIQKNVRDMTTEDLQDMAETVKGLEHLGRVKAQLTNLFDERKQMAALERLIESTNNLDPKNGAADRIMTNIKHLYLATLHTPRVADLIDGLKDYMGENARIIKAYMRGETAAKQAAQALVDAAMEELEALGVEFTEEFQRDVMIHIRFEEGAYDAVNSIMDEYDLDTRPELPEKGREVIDIIRKYTTEYQDEISSLFEHLNQEIFELIKNYTLPLLYKKTVPIDPGGMINHTTHRTSQTAQGFTRKRVKGVRKKPRIDLLGVFEEAINAQQWYLRMQPLLEQTRPLVTHEAYQAAAGEMASRWWQNYIDTVARRGWMHNAKANPLLRRFRINLNQARLGFKLSSAIMQPFAVIDGAGYMMSRYGPVASAEVVNEVTKAWVVPGYKKGIVEGSAELQQREGGEVAIEEVLAKAGKAQTLYKKFIRSSLAPLKEADLRTAAGVQQAIENVLKRHGATDPKGEAEFLMNMTQGSAEVTMRPQILAKGEMMRTWFTFKSFFLNRWGLIAHDIVAKGLVKSGGQRRLRSLLAIAILMAGGLGEDEARRFIYELSTGRELPDEEWWLTVLLYLPRQAPFVGEAVDALFSGRPIEPPAVNIAMQGFRGAVTTARGLTDMDAFLRGSLKTTESVLSLIYGVPGTAQSFDLLERLLREENKTRGSRSRRSR